ncbi:MAG: Ig-like domain-containing protein [Fibrobacterota bacterium]
MRRRASRLLAAVLMAALPLFAGRSVKTDLSAPVALTDARVLGTSLSPGVDSTHYVRLGAVDILASGSTTYIPSKWQAAWPTLVSTDKNRFCFSYIFCRTAGPIPEGNYYFEKRMTLFPDRDSVAYDSSVNSAGKLLTKWIPVRGGNTVGGVNAKSLLGPNQRVYRLCQGSGGTLTDSIFCVDAPLPGNGMTFTTHLDNILNSKTYVDYVLNTPGDTLFTVYDSNIVGSPKVIKINPVRLLGSDTIQRGIPVTILRDVAALDCRDLSMARDSASGVFLIAGLRDYTGLLLVRAAANFTDIDTLTADVGVYNPSQFERNIRVVSLGHLRFAVAYGKADTTLLLKLVDASSGVPVVTGTVTLEPDSGVAPSLSYAANRLGVAWVHRSGRALGDNGRLVGRLYDLVNGSITDTIFSGQISVSNNITEYINNPLESNNYNTAIALDTAGSFVAAFADHDFEIYSSAFMALFYYYDTAYAVVEDSLDGSVWGSFAGDSITYTGFSFTDTGSGGSASIEFDAGTSAGFVPSFQAVSGATILRTLAENHYQYNVRMVTAVTGRQRPVVCSLGVTYNVKPKGATLDSFRINGDAAALPPDDTVRLVARTDILRIFTQARDYDGNAVMTGHFTGLGSSFDDTLRNTAAMTYACSTQILPIDHADTVYRLAYCAADSNGWGSDTDYVYVKLHNPAPVLTASDTVFYAGGSRSGTLSGHSDTVRFMKRQNLILRFDLSDANDAATLTSRSTLSGALRKNYVNVQTLLDTLLSSEMASDTECFAFVVRDPGGLTDSLSFTVIAYNPTPVLTALDTVFFTGGSRYATLVGHSDTVRFMKRQNLILRFDFTDSNDASVLSDRSYLAAAVRKNYANVQTVLDTLTAWDMAGDTARFAFTVRDPGGSTDSISFTAIAYNPPPSDSLAGDAFTFQNSLALARRIQSGDTAALVDSGFIVFHAFGRDSNETDLKHVLTFNGQRIDSAQGALHYTDTLYADSVHDLDTIGVIISDTLVMDTIQFYVRVTHQPRIVSLLYQNPAALFTQDSVAVNIRNGVPDTFVLTVSDPDVGFGDSLTYIVYIIRSDTTVDTQRTSVSQTFTWFHAPGLLDRRAVLRVNDRTLFSDSVIVDFLYPVFSFGPAHAADSLYFTDSIARYVTRSLLPRDSVSAENHVVALANLGTDTLRVTSVLMKSARDAEGWLRFGWAADATGAGVSLSGRISTERLLLPSDTAYLVVRDSAAVPFGATPQGLRTLTSGDTVIYDTLGLVTNDPLNDTVWIPVRIVCNELPYAVGDSLLFIGDVPLLPKTHAVAAGGAPYAPFKPGYRTLALVFNEFLDTLTVTGRNLLVYSALDSALFAASVGTDSFQPIPGSIRWGARTAVRQDTLFFTPAYTSGGYTSPAFGNAQPPDGYFVAADRLRVRVSRNVLDIAGNGFDVAGIAQPDPVRLFRFFGAVLDSSSLRVISLSPDSGAAGVDSRPVLRITFSAPLDSASVDTARTGNRSVRVVSSFNIQSALPLASAPSVNGTILTVVPDAQFYSGDSIIVTLSAALRDTFHGTLDGNGDGRGAYFYRFGAATYAQVNTFTDDPDTSADNYAYWFRVATDAFYFYPCPYEPARNVRHEALGGVVFKNLHALEKNQSAKSLNVRIYDVAGDLVYSTRQKNAPIRFDVGTGSRPEWRWDTRNGSGRAVGSGLYLFSFTDSDDKKVIKQGKLIVIR